MCVVDVMVEQATLADVIRELAEERGIDLRGYKHTTLERRIQRRMQQLSIGSYREYLDFIRDRPTETNDLLNTVLINVTGFFRDIHAWDTLQHEVLPVLFRHRSAGTPFRVWCAGCATGEEAYSSGIMLCEFLGPGLKGHQIKIYATDHDEEALTIARRGEYSPERLRGVHPEIRERYFSGETILRVARDVRRMVIFGRSNLLTDAPISHVDLLICRNVLIYFDSVAQEHIMRHLHYALKEGGVLFLGKAESQLKRNSDFVPISPRWRIFQRRSSKSLIESHEIAGGINMDSDLQDKEQQELKVLKSYYDALLGTLESGVVVVDSDDTVVSENDKVRKLWDLSNPMGGQKLQDTELWQRCPELKPRMEESRRQYAAVHFDCYAGPSTLVNVTIKPIVQESGSAALGTLIYMGNVTPRVALQSTIEEIETTAEELQSTNEELETTNEELQSLNEELETTNEELSSRIRELGEVNARYSEMLERMPWPVLLADQSGFIYMFNSAAQKLFGFAEPSQRGIKLEELPMDNRSRRAMLRRHQSVVKTKKQSNLRDLHLVTNRFDGETDVNFTPLARDRQGNGVIMMFEVQQAIREARPRRARKPAAGKATGASKKKKRKK